MPRPDRKVADRRALALAAAHTEKPRAKAVRRAAGALEAGRIPGGAYRDSRVQASMREERGRRANRPCRSPSSGKPGRLPGAKRNRMASPGVEQTKGTRNPRPRAVRQGKRRAARRATMSGNGTAAAKAARRRNKEHRFRKRFIRRNAWTEKVPPQESGESLGNKNPRRRLSPRQQRRAPENASGDGISAPLPDDATPPPDARQARVQRGQRA